MIRPPVPLAEPPAESVIAKAVSWADALAFGSIATLVSVIAVATVGLLLLAGRLELRRGMVVILGCFILFGARDIARAFQPGSQSTSAAVVQQETAPVAQAPAAPSSAAYDPYAGAATPLIR